MANPTPTHAKVNQETFIVRIHAILSKIRIAKLPSTTGCHVGRNEHIIMFPDIPNLRPIQVLSQSLRRRLSRLFSVAHDSRKLYHLANATEPYVHPISTCRRASRADS